MPPSIFSFKLTLKSKDENPGTSNTNNRWARLSFVRKKEPPDPMRTRLPTELYRHIFSFIPPDAKLYPLLLVNFGFHAEAELLLYTNIVLEGDCSGRALSYANGQSGEQQVMHMQLQRRIILFNILARTPRLSKLVHSLSIYPFSIKWVGGKNPNLRYVHWHLLNLALRGMSNLKELTFSKFAAEFEILPIQSLPAVVRGCSFRLRKLGLLNYSGDELQSPESDVVSQLEEIAISRKFNHLDLDKALPKLVVLEAHGSPTTSSWLVDSDRIRALYLVGWAFWPSVIYRKESMRLSYHQLRSFRMCAVDAGALVRWPRTIPMLLDGFPSLSFFRLDYASSLNHLAQVVREVAPALRALRRLKKIVLCSGTWDNYDWYPKHWTTGDHPGAQSWEIAQELFTNIPQLEVVRVGLKEWNRVKREISEQAVVVTDNPNEWKDEAFWR